MALARRACSVTPLPQRAQHAPVLDYSATLSYEAHSSLLVIQGIYHRMNLRSLDLNLLPVLEAIHTERSLTRASESLHITQPAVSNALARLRLHFEDPLFVREGRGVKPTAMAEALMPAVREALDRLRAGLEPRSEFDPARSTRVFNISARDASAYMLAAPLARRLDAGARPADCLEPGGRAPRSRRSLPPGALTSPSMCRNCAARTWNAKCCSRRPMPACWRRIIRWRQEADGRALLRAAPHRRVEPARGAQPGGGDGTCGGVPHHPGDAPAASPTGHSKRCARRSWRWWRRARWRKPRA
jgi:hypothetical protein